MPKYQRTKKRGRLVFDITIRFFFLTLVIILAFWLAAGSNQIRLIAKNAILQAESVATDLQKQLQASLAAKPVTQHELSEIVSSTLSESLKGAVAKYVFVANDGLIVATGGTQKQNQLTTGQISGIARVNQATGSNQSNFYATPDFLNSTMELFIPVRKDNKNQYFLVAEIPMTSLNTEIKSLLRLAAGMGLLIFVIQIYFGRMFFKSLIQPVQQISGAVEKFGRGEPMELALRRKKRDEIEILQENLLSMGASITEQKAEIEKGYKEIKKKSDILQFELNVAQKIQASILPKNPQFPDALMDIHYQPLYTVSGDYYDIFQFSDGSRGYLIADASGHGVPAALLTIMAKVYFSSLAEKHKDPSELFKNVNILMSRCSDAGHYLTAVYFRIYPDLRAEYCNGTHPDPLVFNPDTGEIRKIESTGFYIGLMEEIPYEFITKTEQFRPGERIILYTDGVTEAMNAAGNMFGEEGLIASIRSHASRENKEFQKEILSDLKHFIGDRPLKDDVTLITIDLSSAGIQTSISTEDTLENALGFYLEGNYQSAVDIFRRLSPHDIHQNPANLAQYADAALKSGAYAEAENLFHDYLRIAPEAATTGTALVLLKIGLCRARQEKHAEALDYYSRAAGINPKLAEALAFSAVSHLKLGQAEAAKESIDQALLLKSTSTKINKIQEFVMVQLSKKTGLALN